MLNKSEHMCVPIEANSMLKQLNCEIRQISELTSGIKLARITNYILFDNTNLVLSNQIITTNQQRKGNNVINLNIVLKQVKANKKINCPQLIKDLTAFKLIDNQQQMLNFVNWLSQCWKTHKQPHGVLKQNLNWAQYQYNEQTKQNYLINQKNTIKKQQKSKQKNSKQSLRNYQDVQNMMQKDNMVQNAFENVYFLDRDLSPTKNNVQLNDSLEQSQKISKKGSFKILRPKTGFNFKEGHEQNVLKDTSIQSVVNSNKSMPDNNQINFDSEQIERKEINHPILFEKPPLYKKNKMQLKSTKDVNQQDDQNKLSRQMQIKDITSHNFQASSKQTLQQISQIQEEIRKQYKQSSESRVHSKRNTSHHSQQKSKQKNTKKIFKIQIKEVKQEQKKSIILWLVSIKLLNSLAINYYSRFHEICKNGVIFVQIINYHKGRSKQICYFKNPTKSAEMHSNYQKVFTYLKETQFQSQLLFMYEYFIPQAIENAFWSFLKSCQMCFQKQKLISKNQAIFQQEFKMNQQSSKNLHLKAQKSTQNTQSIKKRQKSKADYENIKYISTKKIQRTEKSENHRTPKAFSIQKQSQPKRKASLQFIKLLPQNNMNLKQKQPSHNESQQSNDKIQPSGYFEIYSKRKEGTSSKFCKTPDKTINRSRASLANSSFKKTETKTQHPSISLQMEIKAISFLKQKFNFGFPLKYINLFEDPIRNGVLFNTMIMFQGKVNYRILQKPRSIIDCRQNFIKAFNKAKQIGIFIPNSYEHYFQEIIRGELSLFYGLVCIITDGQSFKTSVQTPILKNQGNILNISNYSKLDNFTDKRCLQQIICWIRQLEQSSQQICNLKIRDQLALFRSVVSNNLLYKIASSFHPEKYTIKPTYERPTTQLQSESNIKKILSFLSHNKILKPDFLWKSKSIVKKQKNAIYQILKYLMEYSKKIKNMQIHTPVQNNTVTFQRFQRQKQSESEYKRMNNSISMVAQRGVQNFGQKQQNNQTKEHNKNNQIQVPWMRSLGFSQFSINNGVILCRLISKLTMHTLNCNQNPVSKAQCLCNIRKAIKQIQRFKWDQQDIFYADSNVTNDVYRFLKQKYKNSYAFKQLA